MLGADICYRHALISPLLGLVERALDAGVDQVLIADPGRPPFLAFARHCVEHLHGTLWAWKTDEPLIAWSGQRPTIQGHVLLMGKWPDARCSSHPITVAQYLLPVVSCQAASR